MSLATRSLIWSFYAGLIPSVIVTFLRYYFTKDMAIPSQSFLIIFIFFFIVGFVYFYQFNHRATIRIELSKKSFRSGENVRGKLVVQSRQPLMVKQVNIGLSALSSLGDEAGLNEPVHLFSSNLAQNSFLQTGVTYSFDFSFPIPTDMKKARELIRKELGGFLYGVFFSNGAYLGK
jgi:hypothetical protein